MDVVERQDTPGWIVAALIDEMDGHAATGAVAVLDEVVC